MGDQEKAGRAARPRSRGFGWFFRPWVLMIAGLIAGLLMLRVGFHLRLGFIQTKLVLKATALTLEDVRDMESLITAEYFGEVIGTARDYFSKTAVPAAEAVLVRLAGAAKPEEVVLTDEERRILDPVRAALIKKSKLNPRVIDMMSDQIGVATLVRPELAAGRMSEGLRETYLGILLERRDIAYLARGVVQAGYDLASLDADRFHYSPQDRTVYLQIEPRILGQAINPWFIFDPATNTQVKGFEIIAESNVDLDDDDAFAFINGVKEACRQRLLEDALKAGIKDQARASAEQSLAHLFKMFRSQVEAVRLVGPEEFQRRKNSSESMVRGGG